MKKNNVKKIELHEDEYYYSILRKNIKDIRINKGLTQQELGELTLFSRSKISNIENGRNFISVPDAMLLCEHLEIGFDTLFGNKEMTTNDFLLLADDYFTNKKISKQERLDVFKTLMDYFN